MKSQKRGLLILTLVIVGSLLFWIARPPHHPAAPASEQQRIHELDTVLPVPDAWLGDLGEMHQRRLIRILVPYNKMLYFLDRGQARGIVHDMGKELEKWLNRKDRSKTLPMRVVFIPTAREHLLQDLVEGFGDIAAGNLTVTAKRLELVDFVETSNRDVSEIVVTGPASPEIHQLDDLSAVPIYLRKSSSYYEHLIRLGKERQLNLKIYPADEALEDEDLLEMVNAGLLPLAIVDDHKARFWAQVFDQIVLHEDLKINQGGRIAWAIRKDSPQLRAELSEFNLVENQRQGLGNILLRRYLGTTRYISNATNQAELTKFETLIHLFKKYATKYSLDPLLLTAQAYQESRLNQSARSRAGAVGVMQILPSTAASAPINISGIENDPEKNIHAGAKYLRHLMETYLSDPEIDEKNRLLLALAAYNAGPGNLARIRRKTIEMGLNPNIWFENVEHGAAHVIGRETTQYVSNIYKYYLSYRLVEELRNVRESRNPEIKQDE